MADEGFKNASRRTPNVAELRVIVTRMFRLPEGKADKFTIAGCMKMITNHGRCECGCKTWLLNKPFDFDHGDKPHAWIDAEDYDKPIDWRVLWRPCHKKKTKTVDMPKIVKTRRVARKHGVDRVSNPMPEKRGNRKIQSGGFRQAPEGYNAWKPKPSNVRIDD